MQNSETTLFFALVGSNNNGHNYINSLIEQGVTHFVVEQIDTEVAQKGNFFVVKNSLKALQKLAAYYRKQFNFPIIAITGSNGKTIVKEWLNFLLSPNFNIARSPKSYNSQVGVPLSILSISDNNNLGIFEAGISTTNEMQKLQKIINPTIGILTNIGSAHDEGFTNISQKIKEKLKLFLNVDLLILNKNKTIDVFLNPKIKTFSWSSNDKHADVFVITSHFETFTQLKITHKSLCFAVLIPFQDGASVENAIHCLMVMLYFNIDQALIQNRMKMLYPVEMRLKIKSGINNTLLIDDSYSSDYQSLKIALDFLEHQKQHKKKTLILSDIVQSGLGDAELYGKV
ncbi:MAG: bifunctional UDP-N-acetylmuramoyl-tripeptide:D-alanyl-D-alanine ligase/alanine racemase, partial [Flavobacterium sp.]|nr:bifunctional UDP-N-acetylmuramoyl-tripeptide:D-alanyl-D-alanine ligase/alanine racemase [Flavobacterium sp.]